MCKYKVYNQFDDEGGMDLSFQAGDVYVENNTLTIELVFPDIDGDFNETLLYLNIKLNSTILHVQSDMLKYEYELKRYTV